MRKGNDYLSAVVGISRVHFKLITFTFSNTNFIFLKNLYYAMERKTPK